MYRRAKSASITRQATTVPDAERPPHRRDVRNAPTVRGMTTTDRALIAAAIVMLIVWAVWTFVVNDAPGWVHLFLSVGVFLLIWRIVAVGTPDPRD